MSEVIEGEYRGNAMLILRNSPTDHFPFQFGVKKARLIVDHLDDIIKFLSKYDNAFDVKSVTLG